MKVFLGIGSNLGNKRLNIDRATEMINEEIGKVSVSSSFFESAPWGFESDNRFMNTVVETDTKLSVDELLCACKSIEQNMGRTKTKQGEYEDRIIDIDILFYGNKILQTENITVPHPHITKRDFVMVPLCEIAPNFVHPIIGKSIRELCDELTAKKNTLNK